MHPDDDEDGTDLFDLEPEIPGMPKSAYEGPYDPNDIDRIQDDYPDPEGWAW